MAGQFLWIICVTGDLIAVSHYWDVSGRFLFPKFKKKLKFADHRWPKRWPRYFTTETLRHGSTADRLSPSSPLRVIYPRSYRQRHRVEKSISKSTRWLVIFFLQFVYFKIHMKRALIYVTWHSSRHMKVMFLVSLLQLWIYRMAKRSGSHHIDSSISVARIV